MAKAASLDESALAPQADELPAADWPHRALWERVKDALSVLPEHFAFPTIIEGVPAPDIPSANTFLGSGIEAHIPKALNRMREMWDPEGKYDDFAFVRQPQVFPDVPFRQIKPDGETLFALEIKSWYALAREREPSLRITVNSKWCHPADLVVVYPWALSNAIAGRAMLFPPFVTGCRTAARVRNAYWDSRGKTPADKKVLPPKDAAKFWPSKGSEFNDSAPADKGGNFGRLARTGVMDAFITRLFAEQVIADIPLGSWQKFLTIYAASGSLDNLAMELKDGFPKSESVLKKLHEIIGAALAE